MLLSDRSVPQCFRALMQRVWLCYKRLLHCHRHIQRCPGRILCCHRRISRCPGHICLCPGHVFRRHRRLLRLHKHVCHCHGRVLCCHRRVWRLPERISRCPEHVCLCPGRISCNHKRVCRRPGRVLLCHGRLLRLHRQVLNIPGSFSLFHCFRNNFLSKSARQFSASRLRLSFVYCLSSFLRPKKTPLKIIQRRSLLSSRSLLLFFFLRSSVEVNQDWRCNTQGRIRTDHHTDQQGEEESFDRRPTEDEHDEQYNE